VENGSDIKFTNVSALFEVCCRGRRSSAGLAQPLNDSDIVIKVSGMCRKEMGKSSEGIFVDRGSRGVVVG
jgi:hypothetical protein